MNQRTVFLYDELDPRHVSPASAAAQRLLLDCAAERTMPAADLSRTLVILPGRQAVRSVAACLAETGPVFPPKFVTPGEFRLMGMENVSAASDAELKAVWMDVLKKHASGAFPALFPAGVPDDMQSLACHAEMFLNLRKELALSDQYGSFGRACEMMQNDARWFELRQLETEYLAALGDAGLADPSDMASEAVNAVSCFASYSRIVAALTPDLSPAVKARLKAVASAFGGAGVLIYIAASGKDRDLFDEWGYVIPDRWSKVDPPFRKAAGTMHAVADPEEMAELAARLAPDPESGVFDPGKTSIVVTDTSFVPELTNAFSSFSRASGPLPVYDPSGVPMRDLRLVPLLSAFRTLIADGASQDLPAEAVRQLLRLDCAVSFLAHKAGLSPDDLLRFADLTFLARLPDVFHKANMPDGMMAPHNDREAAEGFLAFGRALEAVAEIRKTLLSGGNFFASLREVLSEVFYLEHYDLKFGIPLDDEAALLRKYLDSFESSPVFAGRDPDETLFLLSEALSSEILYPEHQKDALEITGFLEMPFRSASRVILCGMNEGFLPESISSTPFLNDSLRTRLGLPDNASRYARDCFYLKSLMERMAGKVHFIVCKTGPDGVPMRASSLFFAGAERRETLLERAAVLFGSYPALSSKEQVGGESSPFRAQADFRNAFLKDGVIMLNVTQFKQLLASPFRAWLSSVCDMNEKDYLSPEVDASSLGTFVHQALQDFRPEDEWIRNAAGPDPVLRAKAVEAAFSRLYALFLRELRKMLGDRLPLLPMIQTEMWRLRLRKTAEQLLLNGCPAVEREWPLNGGRGIEYNGVLIHGTIDRIEYDERTKSLRLIDFKTGEDADKPEKAHISGKRFIDLQLPLYSILLRRDETFREKHPELNSILDRNAVRCAYFSISSTIEKIGYCFWDGMTELLPYAEAAVAAVIEDIRLMHDGKLPDDLSRNVAYDVCGKLFLPAPGDVFNEVRTVNRTPYIELPTRKKRAAGGDAR